MSVEMNNFLCVIVSCLMWFWLASRVSGSNHVVRINSGVDRGSAEIMVEKFMLSLFWCSSFRLMRLIKKLCDVMLIHSVFLFDSQVRGRSMMDGKIIFSIEVGLDFVRGLCHMCLRFLLTGLVLLLPHMLQIPGLWWGLIGGLVC